ncbi:hypothetical protein, partial [Neisseria meningitidis]|uniref:hypothetical protein n=1 Tax=Neisseria meningitidis TaxID=487 RepID=UPI00195B33D7
MQERPYATAYWPFSVRESCTSNANPPTLKTLVCSLVSLSMVLPAHAQITTDKSAPKNQQVVILKTNTG